MGDTMKIVSSENCLKGSVIFILREKILKKQVMTGFKYLKICHSENNNVLVNSEDISKMNEHTFSGVKCRFTLRTCILEIKNNSYLFSCFIYACLSQLSRMRPKTRDSCVCVCL